MLKALVLVDTVVGVDAYTNSMDSMQILKLLDEMDDIAIREGLLADFECNVVDRNPTLQKRFQQYPNQREFSKRLHLDLALEGFLKMRRSFAEWPGALNQLSQLSVPTLVIVGEEDDRFRSSADILGSTIKSSRVVVIPEVGHYPFQDSHEQFNSILMQFFADCLNP